MIAFVLLWNSGYISVEYGLSYVGPFTLLFWRYWALTLILFVYLIVRGRFRWPGLHSFLVASFVGVSAHGVWMGCVLLSLERDVPAGIIALIVALQPMVTGALSLFITGEKTSLSGWLGLLLGFCGVAIVVAARTDINAPASLAGYLLPFGSVISITLASLVQRRLEIRNHDIRLPLDLALFFQSLATAVVLTPPSALIERFSTEWTITLAGTMVWIVLGVSLGAYVCMWLLISRVDATRVASLFYLGPPVTMVMAWVAFGDIPEVMDMVGLSVVVLGVLLTQTDVSNRPERLSRMGNKLKCAREGNP
jgi:drug/metabolite transporter (DMT)-like permease